LDARAETMIAGAAAAVAVETRCRASTACHLLDGDEFDRADTWCPGQQRRGYFAQRSRDRPVQVGLPRFLVGEGVENAVGRLVDLEGVPGDRPRLIRSEFPAGS